MAFTRESAVKPVAIGDIMLKVFGPGPSNTDEPRSILALIQIMMDNGTTRQKTVDLSDVLTANQINQLNSLVDSIRTQATNAVLPTP